jgi:hypothetical protein
MYQITWKLFAFFSLVLPILAATIPVRKEAGEVEKRANSGTNGRVRPSVILCSGIDISAQGTFFYPGLGSCGGTNTSDQLVVALSEAIIDTATDCGQV